MYSNSICRRLFKDCGRFCVLKNATLHNANRKLSRAAISRCNNSPSSSNTVTSGSAQQLIWTFKGGVCLGFPLSCFSCFLPFCELAMFFSLLCLFCFLFLFCAKITSNYKRNSKRISKIYPHPSDLSQG